MSTLKMTFSLASLILILGLVFATAPVMAQIAVADATSAAVADSSRTIDMTLGFNDGEALGTAATDATIPAKGYLIIHKGTLASDDAAFSGLPSFGNNVATYRWEDMPDLEALFGEEGGTILLKASQTNVDADGTVIASGTLGVGLRPAEAEFADFRYDHDGDDVGPTGMGANTNAVANDGKKDDKAPADAANASAARDPLVDDLTITEIMWALNTANVGSGSEHNHQWIEIWNRTSVNFPLKGIVLHLASGRPALPDTDTAVVTTSGSEMPKRIVLDRVSNVVGAGWVNDVGQNGFDDGTEGAAEVPFVSMYRRRGNDQIKKGTGSAKDHWRASSQVSYSNHKGTPGRAERAGARVFTATTIPRSPIIFNEISNRDKEDRAYEWIELRNVSDGEVNLKNWQISIVTSSTSDKEYFNFYDKDLKVAGGGILLLVVSDPSENPDHPLAAGFNIEKGADDQANGVGAHSPRYLIMKSVAAGNDKRGLQDTYTKAEGLPDDGKFVLILRNGLDKEGKAEKLIDIAGFDDDTSRDEAGTFTGLWPLVNYPKPDVPLNQLTEDTVHRRQHAGIDGTRTTDKKDNADHGAFRDIGWTGIGYKRNAAASAAHGGTPGYPNGAFVSEGGNATDPVIISEIMFDNTRNFSQWIELHNTSKTHGVNITNWSLFVVNHNDTADGEEYAGKLSERIDLPDSRIPPGQTYLIVSRRGSSNTKLPLKRVHSVNKKRTETILNPYGFQITLKAKTNEGDANKHQTVDMVGNLGPAPANSRRADAQSFEDLAWMLPSGTDDDGNRVSINRVGFDKDSTGMNMDAMHGGRIDGMQKAAWIRFDMSEQISLGNYYGHGSDIGSPGFTTGGVLPVSLSKFRPERMKDTGEIVIRWITESELNNAGFNILRSEKRDGEFTKINTKLIAGQGTTSERTTYEYADTSAKPNVVYYYQIQDVSLDGQVTTLRTTHLRGNVTAVGKATTTWGDIKALQ